MPLPPDSPLERLLQRGPGALTDIELVSILLRGQGLKTPALERAKSFLALFGGIPGLLACDIEVTRAQQLSHGQAANLLAAIELGRRLPRIPEPAELLTDPEKAASFLRLHFGRLDQEVLGAIFVGPDDRLLGLAECFRGTSHRMVIDPKTILREALCRNAVGLYVFHLRPGSEAKATSEDFHRREQLGNACDALGLMLHDYLILCGDLLFSLRRLKPW